MADASSDRSDQRPCDVCSAIPPELWANTGRGESLLPEAGGLVRLDLDSRNDLWECPSCESLFAWEDLPQSYGSGNEDEERLRRLTPDQTTTARELLDPSPGERDGARLLDRAFRALDHDLLYSILRYRAGRQHHAFSGLVEPILARLTAENDGPLADAVGHYCGYDRERLAEVIRMLDAYGPDVSASAGYLRDRCVGRLEEANRYRPK